MYADEFILSLNKVNLEEKNLLPDFSGIYYVVDEKQAIWYIGRSINLQKRWNGEKPHHRFHQLLSIADRQKKQFFIYFHQVTKEKLSSREKIHIDKYQPQLNYTPVSKVYHPNFKQILSPLPNSTVLKILSNPIDNSYQNIYNKPDMITNTESQDFIDIATEEELSISTIHLSPNQFRRQFINLRNNEINFSLQIEVCLDNKNRLFVRHYTLFNIYGLSLQIIQEVNDSNAENALSTLNGKCHQLYSYSLKWLGYKLKCENIIIIDEEDDFQMENIAIMLPFRLFIDLLEHRWLQDSSLAEQLEKQDNEYFKRQYTLTKLAKYLYDNNLTMSNLLQKNS